jgi:hypothetical protein
MRQLEVAKISLQRETPLYQIIDEPIQPLSPQYTPIYPSIRQWAITALAISIILIFMIHYKQTFQQLIRYFQ